MMRWILLPLWRRLPNPWKWRILALAHPVFMVSVVGIIRDDTGRVLLLRHRWWQHDRWGLPSGYAWRGETLEAALAREIREETGFIIADPHLLTTRSGAFPWIEIFFGATVTGGALHLSTREIAAAEWFTPSALPESLPMKDRELVTTWMAAHEERTNG